MRFRYPLLILVAAASVLLAATPSHATLHGYSATLLGVNENPPNGSPGTGTASIVWDDVTNTVTTTVNFTGLVGLTTASHFHGPAGPGVNAPVYHPFSPPLGVSSGSFVDTWTGPTPTQIGYFENCNAYANIHTNTFPGGEIRGQVCPDAATPARIMSWGTLKVHYR
jgi:hypothetical protein